MSGTGGALGTTTGAVPFSNSPSVGFDLWRGLGGGASLREVGGTESETGFASAGTLSAETMVGVPGAVMLGTLSGGTLSDAASSAAGGGWLPYGGVFIRGRWGESSGGGTLIGFDFKTSGAIGGPLTPRGGALTGRGGPETGRGGVATAR